jgi:hypothetical protein
MDIAANSPGSQNIVHDKKQQGAARGDYAVLRFTCADHEDRLCCSLKSQRRQRRRDRKARFEKARKGIVAGKSGMASLVANSTHYLCTIMFN